MGNDVIALHLDYYPLSHRIAGCTLNLPGIWWISGWGKMIVRFILPGFCGLFS